MLSVLISGAFSTWPRTGLWSAISRLKRDECPVLGPSSRLLSLCVSDRNKALLLTCEVFIPLLVDSLLLDPAHPRINDTTLQGKSDWEGAKAPVQRVRHRLSVHHRLSVYSI